MNGDEKAIEEWENKDFKQQTTFLYDALFIVFAEFVVPANYCGVKRALVKGFMSTIDWLVKQVIGLKALQSSTYLLTIFESISAPERTNRDIFDFNNMSNLLLD